MVLKQQRIEAFEIAAKHYRKHILVRLSLLAYF